eukprot:377088-Hanusia_phi.AAC.2
MTQDYTFQAEPQRDSYYVSDQRSFVSFNDHMFARHFADLSVCEENCCEDWKVWMLLRVMIDAKGNEQHLSWLDLCHRRSHYIETDDSKKYTSVLA